MGKKKLTEKQKQALIIERKKKEKENQEILKALQKQNTQQNQDMIKNLNSIKFVDRDNKKEQKLQNKEKNFQKKKQSLQIQEENEEEDENENENDIEIEQQENKQKNQNQGQNLQEGEQIQKKQKLETNNEESGLGINIFQASNFVNQDFQEMKKEEAKEFLTKEQIRMKLEDEAKKLFPDLNLDKFEGNKTLRRLEKEGISQQFVSTEKEEIEYSDHEEILDEDLVKFLKNQKRQSVPVQRKEEIDEVRQKLPVYFKEQEIVEAINNNLITLVCGETGSGKSTQIPQFLYEAGYGNAEGANPGIIGVTQPRRLAAVSLAKRVSEELNTELGKEVIYQVRHESSNFDNDRSKIKFMTDGILMNEMATDFFLTKYSVIIIDEAHERKINTDLLLGLLSRLVNIRLKMASQPGSNFKPLRVVIMSATLRIEDFTKNKKLLPQKINVLKIEARQFPVNIYFNKRTNSNYIEEAVKKCKQIHTKLPRGDVLVFLTGEREIKEFIVLLQSELSSQRKKQESIAKKQLKILNNEAFELNSSDDEDEDQDENLSEEQKKLKKEKKEKENQSFRIISHNAVESEFQSIQNEENQGKQQKSSEEEKNKEIKIENEFIDYQILPLYSKLSMEDQDKVFHKKNKNSRLFIVSTNVAETSLTIPNIKFVVDTGKEKQKIYTSKLAISKHVVDWTSQASSNQRTGRAGRTCAGYCYRLYAPAVFGNIMKKYSDPEIMNVPLENVILHLKNIGIKDILNFPYPTQPDLLNLNLALQNLLNIQAIKLDQSEQYQKIDQQQQTDTSQITDLGRVLSYIPMNPKFSKILLQGRAAGLMGYTLLIVSYLSIEEIFDKDKFKQKIDFGGENKEDEELMDEESDEELKKRKEIKNNLNMLQEIKDKQQKILQARREEISNFKNAYKAYYLGKSDIFVGMNLIGEFITEMQKFDKFSLDKEINKYGKEKGLLSKSLKETYLNINQIIEILDSILTEDTEKQEQIQNFLKEYKNPSQDDIVKLTEIVISCFIDKVARKIKYLDENEIERIAYESTETSEKVYINPKSFLAQTKPDYLVYTEITESKKMFLNRVTEIDNLEYLLKYDFYRDKRELEYLNEPRPQYNKKIDAVQSKARYYFGPKQWELQHFWTTYQEESNTKYCAFARCLLDGEIFQSFQVFKKLYNNQTSAIKPSNINVAVVSLVNQLKNNEIDSKEKLQKKWETNSQFLLEQVLNWIKVDFKQKVKQQWPPKI